MTRRCCDGMLIELEAIEPRFFFEYADPAAPRRLSDALLRRAASS